MKALFSTSLPIELIIKLDNYSKEKKMSKAKIVEEALVKYLGS